MTDSIHILHVDDDPDFAELTTDFLERQNDCFTVDTATSASDGLECLAEINVDCIVSDYDMPGQNGIEFLDAIREDYPNIPFILYTGKGSEEVASEAISAGVTEYLEKRTGTAQYELLANRIQNAVKQYRSRLQVRAQQRQYRNLFEQSSVMFVSLRDENGEPIIVDCNERFLNRLGYDREEVVDRPLRDFFTQDSIRKVFDEGAYEQTIQGEFQYKERELLAKNGEVVHVLTSGSPRVNYRGEPIGLLSIYIDITEQKQREQQLEQYETIVETSGDAVHILDPGGRFTFVNEAYETLTGYSEDELLGEHVSLMMNETDITKSEALIEELLESEDREHGTLEVELITADGARVPTEVQIGLLLGGDEFRGTVGIHRDITERKEREQELRRLKEEYETIFETAEDAIFFFDVEQTDSDYAFRLRRLNPAYEAITGLSAADARGKTPQELFGDETGAEVVANYRRCVDAKEPISYEEVLEMPAGKIYWQTTLAPVVDDGEVTRIVGVAEDVTEQREREHALERQNERLNRFASVISHDLRNPLNVAEGRLKLATEECDSEHLEAIAQAHSRMSTLIEDTLALARAGESIGDTESVNLSESVDACWQNVEMGSATLVSETDNAIKADRTRLQQLLENLLRNAVEHGGEEVTIIVGDLPDGFYVADDGPGIPEDERGSVLDAGFSTAEEGTGFGLSIVREIAEAHGWDITVTESEPGGARFEISGVEFTDK